MEDYNGLVIQEEWEIVPDPVNADCWKFVVASPEEMTQNKME